MKRVLNSGGIKLPYIVGSEQLVFSGIMDAIDQQDACEKVFNDPLALQFVKFTFEIKAPLLIFNIFQNANLGTLKLQETLDDHQMAYLPPIFYKSDALQFISMDTKQCNELTTKLNNFFNWSFNFYNKLIEQDLCKEQAQLVLPQGLFATSLWDITAKELITFIEQNYNKSPEACGYCSTLVLYLEEHLPIITKWLKKNKWKNLI